MITRINEIHQLHVLMVLITLPSTFDAGNLKLVFDDIQCGTFNGYVQHYSCAVDKSLDEHRLNVDIQMQKEVQDSYYDFVVHAKGPNRDPFTVFKAERITYCSANLRKKITDPIFMTLREMVRKAGSLPMGCPIPANFHYNFRNISINTDLLPSYAPKLGLKINLVFYNRKDKFLTITTLARITPTKMRNKKNSKN